MSYVIVIRSGRQDVERPFEVVAAHCQSYCTRITGGNKIRDGIYRARHCSAALPPRDNEGEMAFIHVATSRLRPTRVPRLLLLL
jgi:hypothetical protein